MSKSRKEAARSEARTLLASLDVDDFRELKDSIRDRSKGKTPTVGVTVSPEIYAAVSAMAERLSVTRSHIVRDALQSYFGAICD